MPIHESIIEDYQPNYEASQSLLVGGSYTLLSGDIVAPPAVIEVRCCRNGAGEGVKVKRRGCLRIFGYLFCLAIWIGTGIGGYFVGEHFTTRYAITRFTELRNQAISQMMVRDMTIEQLHSEIEDLEAAMEALKERFRVRL